MATIMTFLLTMALTLAVTGCASSHRESRGGESGPSSDGLVTSRPEEEGFDAARLAELERRIDDEMPDLVSLLIARNGSLVFEYYRLPHQRTQAYSIQSATKSFTGALVGIALRQGYLDSLDHRVIDFFPECCAPEEASSQLESLTIRHLLTMTAGFANPVAAGPSPPVEEKLHEGFASDPGTTFAYDNGVALLLSAIITRATGRSTLEFAQENLFGPLGYDNVWWAESRDGYIQGDAGLMMTSREMMKFGLLYLDNGVWNGRQLVPAEWVWESTRAHSPGGFPEERAYGYQWWIDTDSEYGAYFAAGFGGQYIYVVPELHHVEHRALITGSVIPAIVE